MCVHCCVGLQGCGARRDAPSALRLILRCRCVAHTLFLHPCSFTPHTTTHLLLLLNFVLAIASPFLFLFLPPFLNPSSPPSLSGSGCACVLPLVETPTRSWVAWSVYLEQKSPHVQPPPSETAESILAVTLNLAVAYYT